MQGNQKKRRTGSRVFLIFAMSVIMCCFVYVKNSTSTMIMPQAVCCCDDQLYFIGNKDEKIENEICCFNVKERVLSTVQLDKTEIGYWQKIACSGYYIYAIGQKRDGLYKIVVFKEDGKCIHTINIDKVLINNDKNDRIKNFLIDSEGNFFIRTYLRNEMLVFNPKGDLVSCIKDFSEDSFFECMTVCDGIVYALFSMKVDAGGGYVLVTYQIEDAKEIYLGDILPYTDIYSVMGTGAGYDLLIKGDNAIYGYRFGEEKAELLTTLLLKEYDFTRSCFSSDGRLIYFGIKMSQKNTEIIETVDLKIIDLNENPGVSRSREDTIKSLL